MQRAAFPRAYDLTAAILGSTRETIDSFERQVVRNVAGRGQSAGDRRRAGEPTESQECGAIADLRKRQDIRARLRELAQQQEAKLTNWVEAIAERLGWFTGKFKVPTAGRNSAGLTPNVLAARPTPDARQSTATTGTTAPPQAPAPPT